jgi:hypothetical protein
MRTVNDIKKTATFLFLASCLAFSFPSGASAGQLWFGAVGPTNSTQDPTSTGASDDRIGFINSDGTGLTTVAVDSTNSFYCVGLDTNAGIYFGLASDGSLHSGYMTTGPTMQSYSGTTLANLVYIGQPGDSELIAGATVVSHLYTADAGRAATADSPSVYAHGPFGALSTFSSSYQLLADNVPPNTSPYWIVWVSPPGDSNPNDEIAVIQYNVGNSLNNSSTIHVIDPNGVIGTYTGTTLAALNNTKVPPLDTYTFGQMIVQFAGVEIGNWGVSDSVSASADIEAMSISYAASGTLQTVQITDVPQNDLAYSLAVDSSHHIIYLGLWGNDVTGADLIEIPYNPEDGQMSSPYDAAIGAVTNANGVLLSFESSDFNFVMAREMWVAPGGGQIYYVDDDFGDPGDYADNVHMNGVFVVSTTNSNPQPQMLTLASQFPLDYSQGYVVGMAVNQANNLIYFATAGLAEGVGVESNTIWSMPIAGGTATAMPLPKGYSLAFPNYAGGCLALDSTTQTLYVSDEGRGNVMQLSLSANGLSFTGGTSNFFTLDTDHLTDGSGGYPSAFVQGITFDSVATVAPPPPPPTTRLTIVRRGTDAVVSWPVQYSEYTLQYSSGTGITNTGWTAYPGPFGTNNLVISTTNVISGKETFFRLFY